MPFTIGGDWIPSKKEEKSSKPVKVRLVKRGKNLLTTVLNLTISEKEMGNLASALKKKLGCGGAVKDQTVEIQGDKVAEVIQYLQSIGIKSS